MRIRIWNSFASNNSGSYTIVGSFDSPELASEIASELAELMRAHAQWLDSEQGPNKQKAPEGSPLAAFVSKHGLHETEDVGTGDDWPQYDGDNVPKAFAVDRKVIIHSGYTVTMPRVFGEYFYSRGGRVDHELNHAHHPIVGVFELWIPWQERKEIDVPAKVKSTIEALQAEGGPLVTGLKEGHRPAWRAGDDFGEANLTIGAVFEDLLAGFTAVERVAKANGFRAEVKVFEAWGEGDPLAFLRQTDPAP